MKQLSYLSLAIAIAVSALGVQGAGRQMRPATDIMKWMPKASADPDYRSFGNPKALEKSQKGEKKTALARETEIKLKSLPAADDAGICDAPDLTTWFYTMNLEKEEVQHEHYTETFITGYSVTIYNERLESLGSFSDKITLKENETKAVQVQVGPQITKKFFNLDDKYEVMMSLAINTTEYVNNYYTVVYQLDNDTPVTTIPGIYVSAINSATDSWSEKFWITFNTEEETKTPMVGTAANMVDYVYTTYKGCTSAGFGDPVLVNRMPAICTAGEDAIPMLAKVKDGQPYFAFNYLKYCWYEEPYNWENETPTPDNELIVDIYTTPTAWATTIEKYSTTTFPLDATLDDRYFLMLGTFSYNNDLAIDVYGEGPALIVTKATWMNASEEYIYDYDVYQAAAQGSDAEGKYLLNIAKDVDGGFFMADVDGYDPQVLFIDMEEVEPVFNFVNLLTGKTLHSLPYRIADGLFLTAETERVAGGSEGYLYVAPQTQGYSDDEGNTYTDVLYVTPEGRPDHIDALNLGQNVDYAQVYAGFDGFDPFIFNLDTRREYMVLVKRRDAGGGNHEELMVLSDDPKAEPLLVVGPDKEKGALSGIAFANLGTDNAALVVIFYNGSRFTTVEYALPFTLFEAGDGTIDNPYIITSIAGLEQLKKYPSAHFAIGADIDATGHPLVTNDSFDFTGSLDGRNHIISNLRMVGRSVIPSMTRGSLEIDDLNKCAVRNINFVNPVYESTRYTGAFLVDNMTGGIVENVHIYGGKMTSTGDFGGLVGMAALNSRIEGCSVEADINAPSGNVGGIAIRTRTGGSVNACAFKGNIVGETEVGGILSNADNGEDRITNCHVDATIKGQHTVGGLIGYSSRAYVAHCYVEGSVEATTIPRWGGGAKVGGLIGGMEAWYPSDSQPEQPEVAIVTDNVVAITSLTAPKDESEEKYPGRNDTVHRIVGYSQVNSEPEEVDYDSKNDKVIYGDPRTPDKGIVNNYAISTLALGSEGAESGANTPEGESIAPNEITREWLESLGFAYGADVENPWSYTGVTTLWYEGGLLVFMPATAEVTEGLQCKLALTLIGADLTEDMIESFTCDISDESVLEMGDMAVENGSLVITFRGLKEGQATVKAGLNGKTAEATVTVIKFNGVETVVTPTIGILYNGMTATAVGCAINVYTTAGALQRSGHDTVDLTALAKGIYIVTATDAAGRRSSIKVTR